MTDAEKCKAAFMNLLDDYGNDHLYVHCNSFCEICPLRAAGKCSGDNGDYEHDTCAEEIFKHYLEEVESCESS